MKITIYAYYSNFVRDDTLNTYMLSVPFSLESKIKQTKCYNETKLLKKMKFSENEWIRRYYICAIMLVIVLIIRTFQNRLSRYSNFFEYILIFSLSY